MISSMEASQRSFTAKSAPLDVIAASSAGQICMTEIFITGAPRKIARKKITTWQYKIISRGVDVGLATIVALYFSLNPLDKPSASFAHLLENCGCPQRV